MNQESTGSVPNETENTVKTVVLVGHCGFDQSSISRAVSAVLPSSNVTSANNSASLDAYSGPDALLLINRVLDGRFSTGSGVDLIADLAGRDNPPKMMLISNFPDAQAQAVAAGALPGFGKSELGSPETSDKLRTA